MKIEEWCTYLVHQAYALADLEEVKRHWMMHAKDMKIVDLKEYQDGKNNFYM